MPMGISEYHLRGFNKRKAQGYNYNHTKRFRKLLGNKCAECGNAGKIIIHHIDNIPTHNVIHNVLPLCRSCHTNLHIKLMNRAMRDAENAFAKAVLETR